MMTERGVDYWEMIAECGAKTEVEPGRGAFLKTFRTPSQTPFSNFCSFNFLRLPPSNHSTSYVFASPGRWQTAYGQYEACSISAAERSR